MENKIRILESLGFDRKFCDLCRGNIDIPIINRSYNPVDKVPIKYPYPPMLLPLFMDYSSPSMQGVLLHPFSKIREPISFVEFYLEGDYMLEKARTRDQIVTSMILQMDMVTESITEEIIQFSSDLDFAEFQRVDDFGAKYGDDSRMYRNLIYFDVKTPLTYCSSIEEYNGNYISSEKLFNSGLIKYASTYEVANKAWLSEIEHVPIWFDSDNLPMIFKDFMERHEYERAWITLNSHGWTRNQIIENLKLITDETKNMTCGLILDSYLR